MFNLAKIMHPNTVVNCRTEAQAKAFCNYLHSHGLRWSSGISYISTTNWDEYREDTCYYPAAGEYTDLDYFKDEGYTILSYEEALLHKCIYTHVPK